MGNEFLDYIPQLGKSNCKSASVDIGDAPTSGACGPSGPQGSREVATIETSRVLVLALR